MESLMKASVLVAGIVGTFLLCRNGDKPEGETSTINQQSSPEPESEMVFITPRNGERWIDEEGNELRATKVGGRPKTVNTDMETVIEND